MKWNKYTIKTRTEAEDLISAALMDTGIEGIEIEDNVPLSEEDKKKMFIDILPVLPPDEGVAYVSFYLEPEQNQEEILSRVREELKNLSAFCDIGEGTITETTTEDKDWINNWKEFFKPFTIDDIVIKPTWEPLTEEMEGKTVIEIDPGTSFGTGKHETTQLCIRQLRKYVDEDTVLLDVGCGSGILSIIASKLGSKDITGTDIDVHAVESAVENMKENHVAQTDFSMYAGDLISDNSLKETVGFEKYDVIVANILADVIIPLSGVIAPHMKKGGIFISSGIIYMKEEEVKAAIESNGLEIIEITHQGDWVSITARK